METIKTTHLFKLYIYTQ